ncbi:MULTISPECIES: 50S ribosomal protein L10 [Acidithrix]|uniref:Large ribosomal subunit protein uL10 n=2 Tax=root TaxID=1 RepID=A0A0D8HNA1_9ACTN|nr:MULTISPECIES: 50S ribosomal protein L10 [Acidithrix]KJF18596.1 50S ribosomal protein L10 [Acidithrix ferrooxidans]
MDNPRPDKVAIVEELNQKFASSAAVVVAEYRGLKVSDLEALRRSLALAGGSFKVYKNTLVKRSADAAGLEGLAAYLDGPTALAFVETDVVEVAKVLKEFTKTHPLLVVKAGVLGNSVIDAKGALALAELPSREALLGQLAGVMAAPMRDFASVLKALPQNFAYALSALVDKQTEEAA